MEDLRTWIGIIKESKFKTNNQLNLFLEPGTQMRLLYDAVVSDQNMNEGNLIDTIPEFGNSPAIFATVKSKLKERLCDALLLLEFNNSESSDRQKAYIECVKKWTAATILLSKNYRRLGIQKMEQILRITKRFEFTEISIEVLHTLRLQSCVIFGNEAQYKDYDAQLQQFVDLRKMEDMAETAYTHLMITFINSKSDKREMADSAYRAFVEIKPLLDNGDSYRLHLFGRLIQIAIHDNQNDYPSVIRLCEEAIAFFDKKNYKSFKVLQVFHYSLMMSYLNLQQYKRCRAVAQEYEDLFTKGSYNWFKWQELAYLTELHDGEYEKAAKIWRKATSQQEYEHQLPHVNENWKIFDAYQYFLVHCGVLKDKKPDKKFRIGKLMNDIHVAQRDKSGMNIPVLVIQYLLALAENDLGQCIDREESMAKYRTRYLSPTGAARSHYFFRMLELLPKSGFDPVKVERKAAPFLEKLKMIRLEVANQNFEVEVIPYESLWKLVMGILHQRASVAEPYSGNRQAVLGRFHPASA